MRKIIFVVACLLILLCSDGFADDVEWVKVPINLKDSDTTCFALDKENPDILYIGTDKYLYKSLDSGSTWQIIFICSGEERGINDIAIYNDSSIFISTRNGLYRSADGGKKWEWFIKEINLEKNIKSFAMDDDKNTFYILTQSYLYKKDKGKTYEKIFSNGIDNNANEEIIDDNEASYNGDYITLKKITIDKKKNLYLSTDKGLFISENEGRNWRKFNQAGLLNNNINFCLISEKQNKIYVATEGGVFEYFGDEQIWKSIYKGLSETKIKYLSLREEKENLWCLADNYIYKTIEGSSYFQTLYSKFNNEPSIREVQNMAIKYAEVSPDKIRKWRTGAKYRAILPKVSFGIDNSVSDTYDIYTSTSTSYTVVGPKDYTGGWDLNFTWDLADLVYNESQTSIDVRSKLMVQLREDILNEVNRFYFERRRIQMELASGKPATETQTIEKKLRLEELTASIDALTGGAFSDAVERNKRNNNNLF